MSSTTIAPDTLEQSFSRMLKAFRDRDKYIVAAEVHSHFCFGNTGDEVTLVIPCDVLKLVRARLELHHEPGHHPTTHAPTRPILAITTRFLTPEQPQWWTTPGLGQEPSASGAFPLGWSPTYLLWKHPKVQLPENLALSVS